MKPSNSQNKRSKEIIENIILIAVGIGGIIAINTQELAWGMIPIAIAIILNKWYRKREQQAQQNQSFHLEKLVQKSQTDQENQQLTLWELQQHVKQLQQSITKITGKQAEQNSQLKQLETVTKKQTQLEKELEQLTELTAKLSDFQNLDNTPKEELNDQQETNLSSLQNQIDTLKSSIQQFREAQTEENHYYQKSLQQLKQELDTAQSFNPQITSSPSIQTQINYLQNYLKQLTQLLNVLSQRQTEQNNYHQQLIEQLKQELEEVQRELVRESQSNQQKIETVQNALKQLTQLLTSVAKRQTTESQTLETQLNQLQFRLDQLGSSTTNESHE